ncbi:hypothetical protein AND4_09939 [Vibrio sp. AND4]|nr:hypothetical protein AND4_09939 [Vibrio sp. AND4]
MRDCSKSELVTWLKVARAPSGQLTEAGTATRLVPISPDLIVRYRLCPSSDSVNVFEITSALIVCVLPEEVNHRVKHNAIKAETKTNMKVFGLSNVFSSLTNRPTFLQQKNRMFKRTMRF